MTEVRHSGLSKYGVIYPGGAVLSDDAILIHIFLIWAIVPQLNWIDVPLNRFKSLQKVLQPQLLRDLVDRLSNLSSCV